MGAQAQLLGVGASILSLANAIGKIKFDESTGATQKAKQSSDTAVNQKKENDGLVEEQIANVAPGKFNIEEFAAGRPDLDDEVKATNTFGIEEVANNSQTNIPMTPEVEALVEVRQKNAMRAAGGMRAANKLEEQRRVFAKSHGGNYDFNSFKKYREEFGWNKGSAEYAKVGIDKQKLQLYALSRAEDGEELAEHISGLTRGMREHYRAKKDQDAIDYIDNLENTLQSNYGSFTDFEDGNKVLDWRQFQIDVDKAVDELSTGKYKEYAEKMHGDSDYDFGGFGDSISEPVEKKAYSVWDDYEGTPTETDRGTFYF